MSKPIQNPELKKTSEQKRNAVVKAVSMPRDFASEISRLTQNVPGGFSRFVVQAIAEKISKISAQSTPTPQIQNFNGNEQTSWNTSKKLQEQTPQPVNKSNTPAHNSSVVQAIAEKFSKSSDLSTSILKLENFNDNEQITWDTIKKFQAPNSTILSPNNQGSKETNSAPGAFSMPLLLKAPQNI